MNLRFKKFFKLSACALAALITAVSVTGCVSEADYKRLERRISALEEIHGVDGSSEQTDEQDNSSSDESSDRDDSENSENSSADFDAERVSEEVDVEEYDYVDSDGDKFAFFVLENNSDFDVNARVNVVSRDQNNRELDEEEKSVEGIPAGGESFVSFSVDRDTATIVRTVTYSEFRDETNPLDQLSARASRNQNGSDITVTNSGAEDVENAKYLALYFSGNTLAGFDADDVPQVSSSSNSRISSVCYENFDTVRVYLSIDD